MSLLVSPKHRGFVICVAEFRECHVSVGWALRCAWSFDAFSLLRVCIAVCMG